MRFCLHLAENTKQPTAVIVDQSGAERHFCGACITERVTALLLTNPQTEVAQELLFDRCSHQRDTAVCMRCLIGINGYLSFVWAMLSFDDQTLATKLAEMIRSLWPNDLSALAANHTEKENHETAEPYCEAAGQRGKSSETIH
jgi:hypothetical protein